MTQWAAPKIALKFEHLAPHLPALAAPSEADVQALLQEGGYENARAFWPGGLLACLRPHPPLGKLPVASAA